MCERVPLRGGGYRVSNSNFRHETLPRESSGPLLPPDQPRSPPCVRPRRGRAHTPCGGREANRMGRAAMTTKTYCGNLLWQSCLTLSLRDLGYSLALSSGVTFTRSLTRDEWRRSLVMGITNSVNGVAIDGLAYSYDALGRPVSRNADTFGYNARGEVTVATIAEGMQSSASATYAYDDIGNLHNSVSAGAVTNSYTANELNQYTSILCASAPLREPTYDLDGNMLSDGILTFAYDAAGRLDTVSSNGVTLVTNFYDAKSRRVRKDTPEATTTFFYDGWNLIEERVAYTNETATTIHYYWGKDISASLQGAGGVGGLLYLTVSNSNSQLQLYIPCYDNNGNITRYLDQNGNTVAQYTYDAFGNTISQSGPLADFFRHRFSTKCFDAESGLYYYGYRFYHPALMRWLTRDPIEEGGGLNLYGICGNNVVHGIDCLGLKWKIIREGNVFATAIPCESEDTFETLAAEVKLDLSDYEKWAHTTDLTPIRRKQYKIPNLIIYDNGKKKLFDRIFASVLFVWRSQNTSRAERERKQGFMVKVYNDVSDSHIVTSLGTDGLYRYTFTGHGDGCIGINSYPDPEDATLPMVRYTRYGINGLVLQACGSAVRDITGENRLKRIVRRNNWEVNVAKAGMFIGYDGSPNLFTEGIYWTAVHGANHGDYQPIEGTKQ